MAKPHPVRKMAVGKPEPDIVATTIITGGEDGVGIEDGAGFEGGVGSDNNK